MTSIGKVKINNKIYEAQENVGSTMMIEELSRNPNVLTHYMEFIRFSIPSLTVEDITYMDMSEFKSATNQIFELLNRKRLDDKASEHLYEVDFSPNG